MTPQQYCQQKAAASGSSFYYSFLFLPAPRREAITALYAFCRAVDDAVDEPSDPAIARNRIAWWRDEVLRLFRGEGEHPVSKALAPCLVPFNITQANMLAVIDGMEMDLEQTRYLDYPGLSLYCERVAGVVGRKAGSVAGFTYSAANRDSGITWSAEKLFQYLEKPIRVVPGTKMSFPGLPKAQDRADVIAYLQAPA